MRTQTFTQYLAFITILLSAFSLDHEKSFLLQDGASNVLSLGLHKESLFIAVSNDIVQRDIQTGAIQRTFRAHDKPIYSFAITNDSRMITSSYDDMIIMWDLETGSILKRIGLRISDMRISSIVVQNDLIIAGGLDNKVRLVHMVNNRVLRTIDLNGYVYSIAVKEEYFYVGKKNPPYVARYLIQRGDEDLIYEGHSNTVVTIHLSNDILVSGSLDATAICWNAISGEKIRVLNGHTDVIYGAGYFDGFVYTGGSDTLIIKWSLETGEILKVFPDMHIIGISCFAYRSYELFSGSIDTSVVRWDAVSGEYIMSYTGRNKKLRAVAAWRSLVISGGEDSEIKVWESSKDSIEPLVVLAEYFIAVNCLTIFGDYLYSGSSDWFVWQWYLINFSNERIFEGPTRAVLSVAADQSFVYAAGFGGQIYQWNISSGVLDGLFSGHTRFVPSLQLHASLLYSGSDDKTVRKWNVQSKQSIEVFESVDPICAITLTEELVVVCALNGLQSFILSTGLSSVYLNEFIICGSIVSQRDRAFSGHPDGIIRVRDIYTLNVLQTYQGHSDYAFALCFDEAFILYSTGFDGSIKKWNMATSRVAYSFENRAGSVTALAAIGNILNVGTKGGDIFSYSIADAFASKTIQYFNQSVTSFLTTNGSFYASSTDGLLLQFSDTDLKDFSMIYSSNTEPLKSMATNGQYIIAIQGDTKAVFLSRSEVVKTENFQAEMVCITATDTLLFAGSRSGIIYSFTIEAFELESELKGHVSQVNSLLIVDERLFSASADKTIIEWSLKDGTNLNVYQRRSANLLGHLGPVNVLSYCFGTLFTAGSDLSVRRWNTQTGRHEDVYFGFSKVVTTVLCHNRSVFAGSEDFSVLMFRPALSDLSLASTISLRSLVAADRSRRIRVVQRPQSIGFNTTSTLGLVTGPIILVLILGFASVFMYVTSSARKQAPVLNSSSDFDSVTTTTDLRTIVNSVMGISKHAAYLMPSSMFAKVRKLASGGGGELFIVKVMDTSLQKKVGDTVIQKVVFVNNKASEEAFFQEVGIMIMLSSFPHFCQIIGYTENPLSMILKYYPDGSLYQWLRKNQRGSRFDVKLLKGLAQALYTMHSHFLAHCDVKSQNVLIQLDNDIPSCYLTDFGITQVLSEKILASSAFTIINLRGLSINYASPEALSCFRSKNYGRVDFKMYDVYSFACVLYETLTRRSPWA